MSKLPILHFLRGYYGDSIFKIARQIIASFDPTEFQAYAIAEDDQLEHRQDLESLGVVTATTREISVQAFIQKHRIALVHSHTPRTAILAAVALRGLRTIPHVTTRHLLAMPQDRAYGWVYTAVDRLSLYIAPRVVTVSKTMAEQIKHLPLLNPTKVVPIPNGVEIDKFYQPTSRAAVRNEFALSDEHVLITFTGRFEEMKRLDILINSFAVVHADHPQTRLMLVGWGSLAEALQQQVETLGLQDAVIFTKIRHDIPHLLAASDIYVQSSNNEGLSLSVLEAMAAGKPVIATEVGAIREIVESDETGIIIDPADTDQLTQSILMLVVDAKRRQAIGQEAHQFVKTHFSVQHMTDRYQALYHQLIKQ